MLYTVCKCTHVHVFVCTHICVHDGILIYVGKRNTMRFNSFSWWRHQMETFSALLAFCAGNSPVTGEFPSQRPLTQSFDVFFLICAWINDWVNNREAGDLKHHRAHYDVNVMSCTCQMHVHWLEITMYNHSRVLQESTQNAVSWNVLNKDQVF